MRLDRASVQSIRPFAKDIEAMSFECQGGPLRNSAPWIELRRRVGAPGAWG